MPRVKKNILKTLNVFRMSYFCFSGNEDLFLYIRFVPIKKKQFQIIILVVGL